MPKKTKLHSGMSFEQIQQYCDELVPPLKEGETVEGCSPRMEMLMLIANLAARMQENAK